MSKENDILRRHSVAEQPSIILDPLTRAEAEARNGLRQFDLGLKIITDAIEKGSDFRWRLSQILSFTSGGAFGY